MEKNTNKNMDVISLQEASELACFAGYARLSEGLVVSFKCPNPWNHAKGGFSGILHVGGGEYYIIHHTNANPVEFTGFAFLQGVIHEMGSFHGDCF
jgi:hypothetical protein